MKRISTLFVLCGCAVVVLAQPTNDNCATAIDLGQAPACPTTIFTNVNATASNIGTRNNPSCFQGGINVQRDVWFVFQTPPDVDVANQNYSIVIKGTATGGIRNPQIALYRGACQTNGLSEWACTSAVLNAQEVKLDVTGLIPGISYYVRVNDYTASGTPNAGQFTFCVKGASTDFIMGTNTATQACSGTLYDSGGPDNNYGSRQNQTFTICPTSPHQCIAIAVESYDIELFDRLRIFYGPDTRGVQVAEISGIGSAMNLEVPGGCVTVQFVSDESLVRQGFKLLWACSATPCTNSNITSCDLPRLVPSLPFELASPSTCSSGNSVSGGPCNQEFLDGYEYVLAYDSPGDECIQVVVSDAELGTGVGVFDACPDEATRCLGFSTVTFFRPNAIIGNVKIENPGRYYIVVGNGDRCTDFSIEIKRVNCRAILPQAPDCDDALPITGCDISRPSIITVAQLGGDPNFHQIGRNNGCWDDIPGPNFVWFYMQAQADGKFGFLLKSADPDEFSDIDINVWGPIANPAQACNITQTRQPIRSTYADIWLNYDLTGLVDRSPITGNAVNDVCEGALSDGFVRTINVRRGEYYYVLVNDFSGVIASGAVSIDFSPTTPGVLDMSQSQFSISNDTVACAGAPVPLSASGALVYQWLNAPELSCRNCPTPIASPTQSTTYQVVMRGFCNEDTLSVKVEIADVGAGNDRRLCLGDNTRLRATYNLPSAALTWSVPSGVTLNCTDCPSPTATFSATGNFPIVVTADFGICTQTDTVLVTVDPGAAIQYTIRDDFDACIGDTVSLGGVGQNGYLYTWINRNFQIVSQQSNPSVVVRGDSIFYLSIKSPDCPNVRVDSVTVTAHEPPTIPDFDDAAICAGDSVKMNFQPDPDFDYSWRSTDGSFTSTADNPILKPSLSTIYVVNAISDPACPEAADSFEIRVAQLITTTAAPDVSLCEGTEYSLNPDFQNNLNYSWRSADGSFMSNDKNPKHAADRLSTTYFVEISGAEPCPAKFDTVVVEVIEKPNLVVMPDTVLICSQEEVVLTADFSPKDYQFSWNTGETDASISVSPSETTVFTATVIAPNGCDTITKAVVVIVGKAAPINGIRVEKSGDYIFEGDEFRLIAELDSALQNAVNFEWTENGNPLAATDSIVILKAAVDGFYTYEVTTEDNNGCARTATIAIEVRPAIFEFPNIFTPDGDDLNDRFGPVALGKLKELLHLQVFNRWGELVFSGHGTDAAWDGTHKGKDAPSDAYYFVARIQNLQAQKEEIVRGDITLLR